MDYRIPVPDIEFNPPVYYCKRRTKPFSLDGNIFKEFWDDIPFTNAFVDIEGDKKEPPFYETQAKMQWDEENFYFAAVLHGQEIWANLTERDSVIFYDNDFEIFIDPDSDTHGYFEFEMNALNTVWDLFLNKPYRDRGAEPLNGWDIKGLRSQVAIKGRLNQVSEENAYWSVEVVIPFHALIERSQSKRPPVCGEYYRVNFSRVQWHVDTESGAYEKKDHPEENWVWAPTGLINIHYPELWGFVFFVNEDEKYAVPEVEKVKWNLRRCYYAMHKFYDEEGFFTDRLSQLDQGLLGEVIPKIEVTSNSFLLSQISPSSNEKILLYDDGKIESIGFDVYEQKMRTLPMSLIKTMSKSERECMEFLYAYMPLSDIADYSHTFILNFVRHGLKAKRQMPWGDTIKKSDFLNYVLQYRINNEHIEFYSGMFFEELMPIIQGLSMKEAAIAINYWCFEKATYQATNQRTGSPLTTIKNAFGRCGEESTFVVAALRSVAIPARQCYAPRWSHCDDNHAWVEVLTEEGWKYLGACEPEMELNRGWFRLPASKAMLIHNRVLSDVCSGETITRQTPRMTEINVLEHYAKTKSISVKVLDEDNLPVEGAKVRFEVVNYSEFYPITTLETNANGDVEFVTGLGDLMVYAYKGGAVGYKKVDIRKEHTIELTLHPISHDELKVKEWIFVPPKGGVKTEEALSAAQQKEHARRVEIAVKKRRAYEATFYNEKNWKEKLNGFNGNEEEVAHLLMKARGNYKEIECFLREFYFDAPIEQAQELQWKIKMLQALPQKDLSDITTPILREHFVEAYGYKEAFDEPIYTRNVLNPRIWIEMITPYRVFIRDFFQEEQKRRFKECPATIKQWLDNHIRKYDDAEYSNLNTSPVGVLTYGGGNAISHKILFVAIARTLGIAAKINQTDGKLCYYHENQWHLLDETHDTKKKAMGTLSLSTDDGQPLKYYHQFTIGKLEEGYYQTLDYEEGIWPQENPEFELRLEPGAYRLVTTNRSVDESNHVRAYYFTIKKGKKWTQQIGLMPASGEKADLPLLTQHEKRAGKASILCWLAPGEEPTEHLLNEIIEHAKVYEKMDATIVLHIPKQQCKQDPTLNKALAAVPSLEIIVDEEYAIEPYYHGLNMMEKRLPLILVTKEQKVNYGFSGYQVGVGQLLIQSV